MPLPEILAALQAAARAGEIDANTAPGVGAVLTKYAVASFAITGGVAQLVGDTAVLTASTSYRTNTSSWALTLTGAYINGQNHFTLELQGNTGLGTWHIGTTFSGLPSSQIADPLQQQVAATASSVLEPLVINDPALRATSDLGPAQITLRGNLPLRDSALEPYIVFLVDDVITVSGAISLSVANAPQMTLSGEAPRARVQLSEMTLASAGLELTTEYIDDAAPGSPQTSAVLLYGSVTVPGSPPITATMTAPLLQGDGIWNLLVEFDPAIGIGEALRILLWLFPGTTPSDFTLPPGIAALDLFGIVAFKIGVQPPTTSQLVPLVQYTLVAVKSKRPWDTPLPFVYIAEVGVQWMAIWNADPTIHEGNIWGAFAFGGKRPTRLQQPLDLDVASDLAIRDGDGDPVMLWVNIGLPSLDVSASVENIKLLKLQDAFPAYFNGPVPFVPDDLTIEYISVLASISTKTYNGALDITGNWPIPIGNVEFNLRELQFQCEVSQSGVSGSLMGFVRVGVQNASYATLMVAAEYPGNGSWQFSGGLEQGTIDIPRFIAAFLAIPVPSWVPIVELIAFFATYSTETGNPFSARGALRIRWNPDVLGFKLSIEARAQIQRTVNEDGSTSTSGAIAGVFQINRLEIGLGASFTDQDVNYLFSISFEGRSLTATTATVGTGPDQHKVLIVTLQNVTLGSMVEALVRLANPNANYQLEAPWTFLNAIDLSRFTLTLDPKLQTVQLDYAVNLSVPFMTLDSVGLVYDRSSGEPAVYFALKGNFLGQDYRTKPLTWDAVNDSPPQVPGQGSQLLDLRYFGMGQHVTLTGLTSFNSVSDVLKALSKEMKQVGDPRQNPLNQPSGSALRFDENSQWMLGVDVTLMDTVALGLVMHDPDLYGIVVALSGSEAGSLSGLSFELLYKKITDDVGVFHVRLQVPDAFRQLQFGAVSVTLGIITVDIFTNGNFLVDLGFPHNRDYSLSFGVEASIFIGRGGIYFGVLDGATSTRIPKITNGTFSPVLELGVGLAVGVGRTFNKGPLSAGLYVELEVIFEGVLGWFTPNDASASKAQYYWCRGSAAIVGKLYGSVDFKIIKVSVSVEAYASVTLTLEAYAETLIELNVGVEVHAEVDILFITISFSFSLQLETSFTIGENSPTPWILADGGANRGSQVRLGDAHVPRRRQPVHLVRLQRASLLALGADPCARYALDWNPATKVFAGGATPQVGITISPLLGVADVPVNWSGQGQPPPNPNPNYRIAFMLGAEGATTARATTIAAASVQTATHSTMARDPASVAFNVLAEAMFRWSVSAMGIDPVAGQITAGQLADLVAQVDCPQTEAVGFQFDNLNAFLGNNVRVVLSGVPATIPSSQPGVAFPMIPLLSWSSPDIPPPDDVRNFNAYQPVDANYEQGVSDYFSRLDPAAGAGASDAHAELDDTVESMARFVFRDYFLLIAKTALQSATSLMTAYPHPVAATDSLATIAQSFSTTQAPYVVHAGDTVDQVAQFFGYSAVEIIALNPTLPAQLQRAKPGDVLTITLGVTAQSIAAANPTWTLASVPQVSLGTLSVQVAANQTLASIASTMNTNLTTWLGTPALQQTTGLVRDQASLTLQNFTYDNTATALTLDEVAAVFFTRFGGGVDATQLAWYKEGIATLNTLAPDGTLPAQLTIPSAYGTLQPSDTWDTLLGDTVAYVAAYCALLQNRVAGSPFATYAQAVHDLNPSPSSTVKLPNGSVTLFGYETLAAFARRLVLDLSVPAQAATFYALVGGANILQPLAVVDVPSVVASTTSGQTLLAFAQQYGLSLEDLATRVAGVTGLLLPVAGKYLTVPAVPSLTIDALVQAILRQQASTIAGQASRFMLSGLRMPAPVFRDGKYWAEGTSTALYDLIGQQVAGPAPDTTLPPETVRAQITLASLSPIAWLAFADSSTVDESDSLDAMRARFPQLHELNPSVDIPGRFRPGAVVRTNTSSTLTISITEKTLETYYPAAALLPSFAGGINAMQLYRDVPVRHNLGQAIVWQTSVPQALPVTPGRSPVAATPTIWTFPSDLLAQAAQDATTAYRLWQTDPLAGPNANPIEVPMYAWATTLDIRIRRISGRPNTFELFGADTVGRQLLLALLQYLTDPSTSDTATLRLLYQLSPGAGMPSGLSSVALDTALTYLIKSNLSTDTRSAAFRARAQTIANPFAAAISDAAAFLTLVWECSVVGGSGYWLQYTATDGSGLPDAIFAQDGTAALTLTVLLGSQTTYAPPALPQRRLRPFLNCAVVGTGVDPSATSLFVEADNAAETTRTATVTPGTVGFIGDLHKPPSGQAISKQDALRQRYSLFGYQLQSTQAFGSSAQGMPVGPQTKKITNGFSQESDEQLWHIETALPVRKFANTYALPPVAALPDPLGDPYAGVSLAGTPQQPLEATTKAQLSFRDVLGNSSLTVVPATVSSGGLLTIDAGYTDTVIGAGSWPSATLDYAIVASPAPATTATLRVTLSAQSGGYLPGYGDPGSIATQRARDGQSNYQRIYYQVMQPQMDAALYTTLEAGADGVPLDLPDVSIEPLQAFAQAAYVWLGALTSLQDVYANAVSAPTLDDAVTYYGTDYDTLANANAGVTLGELIGTTNVTVPRYAVFGAGDTVAGIVVPQGLNPVTVLSDPDNITLPLRVGNELAIPTHLATIPATPVSLQGLSVQFNCTIATLASANQTRSDILSPSFTFDCDGVLVVPQSTSSLQSVAWTYLASGVNYDAVMVAGSNAETPGMFLPNSQLSVSGYIAQPHDTLQRNASGASTDDLVRANINTADLFPAGVALFLSTTSVATLNDMTLGNAARMYGISPGELLRHNGAAPVGTGVLVPGHAALPAVTSASIPYRMRDGDTLAGIAALFAGAAAPNPQLLLAQRNQYLPNVLTANKTITVGQASVTTKAGWSLEDARTAFKPAVQLADVVTAIGTISGYLANGALLLCPFAQLPTAPGGIAPATAATRYGVSAEQLLGVNAATDGMILGGATIAASAAAGAPTVTTASDDTMLGIVQRFARVGVTVSVAQLASVNQGVAFLRPAAQMLLAPTDAVLETQLGAQGGWKFPSAVFPIHVLLEISRKPVFVHPDFRGTPANPGPAVRDRAAVPARRNLAANDDGLTLGTFAANLQKAISPLRVATGRVLDESREIGGTDVWAVAFGSPFIASVAVHPTVTVPSVSGLQPRCYALRPLSTSLIARENVTVQAFNPATGLLTGSTTSNFQGIDLDVWASDFLAGLELFTSAQYAAPAFVANATALASILNTKQLLADNVSQGIADVLDVGSVPPPAARESARQTLRQRLLANISRGYGVASVFQYDAMVRSPWATTYARLSGTGRIAGGDTEGVAGRRTMVSAAKTALVNGSSYVNFTLDLTEPASVRNVPMTLGYAINEFEFNITNVNGYEASDWLTFVTPFSQNPPAAVGIDLGSPEVPIPLRAYPPLPVLVGQGATGPRDPQTLDDALHWTYTCSYAHQSAAQDQAYLQLEFNRPPQLAASDVTSGDDLFAALAQYEAVSSDVWSALTTLQDLPTPVPPNITATIATFATIADRVQRNWQQHWSTADVVLGGPTGEIFEFRITLDTAENPSTGEIFYDTLTMERVAGNVLAWPTQLACTLPSGTGYTLEPATTSSDPPSQAYTFPPLTVPAFGMLTFTFPFGGLHIADYQNAISRVWVVRNEHLVPKSPVVTRNAFVYRTPALAFPVPTVPLLQTDNRLPIGSWSGSPASNPLVAAFGKIFDGDANNRLVAASALYGYDLVLETSTTDPIETAIPVSLLPKLPYSSSTPQDLAGAVDAWFTTAQPAVDRGRWIFDISMYSALDPNLERPVLRLRRLISPLAPTVR